MSKEGRQDSFVPAGKERNQKAWKEKGGECDAIRSHYQESLLVWCGTSCYTHGDEDEGKCLEEKCEAAGKEDEDESR